MSDAELSLEDQMLVGEAMADWPDDLTRATSLNFEPIWVGTGRVSRVRTVVFGSTSLGEHERQRPSFRVMYSREHGYSQRPLPAHWPTTEGLFTDLIEVPRL